MSAYDPKRTSVSKRLEREAPPEAGPASMLRREWEFDLRRIIQANIDRLKELLKTETDPTKRAMERRLLAEEEAKQKQLPAYDKNETKAY
jgi:hypothetical protein